MLNAFLGHRVFVACIATRGMTDTRDLRNGRPEQGGAGLESRALWARDGTPAGINAPSYPSICCRYNSFWSLTLIHLQVKGEQKTDAEQEWSADALPGKGGPGQVTQRTPIARSRGITTSPRLEEAGSSDAGGEPQYRALNGIAWLTHAEADTPSTAGVGNTHRLTG